MIKKIQIRGLAETERLLTELGRESATRVLRSALRDGANIVREAALARAPVGSEPANEKYGRLVDNVSVRPKNGGDGVVAFVLTIGRAFWGMFQEFGTSRMPARPWLRPSFDASRESALQMILQRTGRGITREAMKLSQKYGTLRRKG